MDILLGVKVSITFLYRFFDPLLLLFLFINDEPSTFGDPLPHFFGNDSTRSLLLLLSIEKPLLRAFGNEIRFRFSGLDGLDR